ncbi:MAG: competence/damage-inducible protein A [Acidobacteria bacterium]|nr:MAG: competence/damage-inducible protein A [Acidobacteriota bacterium]REK01787.1 MAG: competence/damage-inducible protein A [Acidobacteriota bacterium]REK14743.1 MAG: competence/damage-inducible protein A [Acidobacteriota bacterium]REK45458.1 MAG: competence/damage-inducible protein A [Acidobacteriota bacterium]
MQTAEIVAIGSELLTPTKTDTNSLWLTELLNEIGIEVMLKTVVGDDRLRLEETLKDSISRSDIVITTGGLGPTEDDITREVAARALGLELEFRQDLVDDLRERFKAYGYEMPEKNKRQAFVIKGSRVLPNPNGSAVGMMAETGVKKLVVLPGPPREAKPMFIDHVLPELTKSSGQIAVRRKRILVSGLGESKLDELISPIYTRYENPQTAILHSKTEVEVQLTSSASTVVEADHLNSELAQKIVEKLGIAVFSTEGEPIEKVVGDLLRERNEWLSTAESCTGGLVAQRVTDVPGASGYFAEGFITYSNEAKSDLLGVDEALIKKHGAVSAEVAEAMAKGARERSGATYGVSTTGIAGPTGGTDRKPVGTVYIGIAGPHHSKAILLNLPGDRNLVRWRTSQAALDVLRRHILKAGDERTVPFARRS